MPVIRTESVIFSCSLILSFESGAAKNDVKAASGQTMTSGFDSKDFSKRSFIIFSFLSFNFGFHFSSG